MPESERTHENWFIEAARWYIEQHQGCCWCGRANEVYRTERGVRVEYECGACEFYVCHEQATDHYFMAPGSDRRCEPSRPTLHAG